MTSSSWWSRRTDSTARSESSGSGTGNSGPPSHWMPDALSSRCYECGARFGTFRRRHHCRLCGLLFCSTCTPFYITLEALEQHTRGGGNMAADVLAVTQKKNSKGLLRACRLCHEFFRDSSSSGRPLRESSSSMHPQQRISSSMAVARQSPDLSSRIEPGQEAQGADLDSSSATAALGIFHHRSRHPTKEEEEEDDTPAEGIIDSDEQHQQSNIVPTTPAGPDWLRGLASTNSEEKLLSEATPMVLPRDYSSPPPASSPEVSEESIASPTETVGADPAKTPQPIDVHNQSRRGSIESLSMLSENVVREQVDDRVKEDHMFLDQMLSDSYDSYIVSYLRSQLRVLNLSQTWQSILLSLSQRVQQSESTYKIKRLPGGSREQSCIVPGIAFTGRVLRNDMPSRVEKARVLLVSGSIAHHSHRSDLVSLENFAQLEDEYVTKTCSQLLALEPDVILVEGSVCHYAHEILQKAGVSLVVCVKDSLIRSIASYLSVKVISVFTSNLVTLMKRESGLAGSRQQNAATSEYIGVVSLFEVRTFDVYSKNVPDPYVQETKSLVVLENCLPNDDDEPRKLSAGYECTVLLRGDSCRPLSLVKSLLRELILLRTHCVNEKAFLIEEHANVSQIGKFKERSNEEEIFSQLVEWPLSPILKGPREMEEEEAVDAFNIIEMNISPKSASDPSLDHPLHTLTQYMQQKPLACMRQQRSANPSDMTEFSPLLQFRLGLESRTPTRLKRRPCQTFDKVENPPIAMFRKDFPLLFASYSPRSRAAPHYCIMPWIVHMTIYGENDLSLLSFLETFCFSETYRCPNVKVCESPMREHIRRFCHQSGSVSLFIHALEHPIVPAANDRDISIWRYCSHCKLITPIVPLSVNAGNMSFAWFLALHFYEGSLRRRGSTAELCKHSLHKEQMVYFSKGHTLVSFEYSEIKPAMIVTPRITIEMPSSSYAPTQTWTALAEANRALNVEGSQAFGKLQELILAAEEREKRTRQKPPRVDNTAVVKSNISDDALLTSTWKELHSVEFEEYRGLQKTLNLHVQEAKDYEHIHGLDFKVRRLLTEMSRNWQIRLTKFQQQNPDDKDLADKWRQVVSSSEVLEVPNLHYHLSTNQSFPVDELQPSSIIAYVLKTAEHQAFLADTFSSNSHFEFQFRSGSDKNRFYCCALFARSFHKLRSRLMGEEAEAKIIASLSRCSSWVPQGGKSGLKFFKTKDERFILKELSKFEMNSLQSFAENYFQYVATKEPTLLAKIVGVFKIGFHTSTSSLKLDVFVMENLFYGRQLADCYDLKGSIRNRLAKTQLVMMDENLLRMSCEQPLYVTQTDKQRLLAQMEKDTTFLCSQAMMDYSLLVGIEKNTGKMVVGIIDYLRTFTWDKRLETLVKSTGLLGGGKTPTIIQPKGYKSRFLDFMNKLLTCVPNLQEGNVYK